MRKVVFFWGWVAVILCAACECKDCEPLVFNPSFQAIFIDTDSIAALNTQIEQLETQSTELSTELSALNTTLSSLEDPDSIANIRDSIQELETQLSDIVERNDALKENRDSVELGWLIIDEILNVTNEEGYVPDTSNVYPIPLPVTVGTGLASYDVIIKGVPYFLEGSFVTRENSVDFDQVKIIVDTIYFDLETTTFDTIYIVDNGFIFEF